MVCVVHLIDEILFFSYLPFCSAAASFNRSRSCATCTLVVTVRAEIEDKMSPPIAPKAGVNGHACQGRSQSRAMGITPIQHPMMVPIAGKTMARSTKFRVESSAKSLIQVQRLITDVELLSSVKKYPGPELAYRLWRSISTTPRDMSLILDLKWEPRITPG